MMLHGFTAFCGNNAPASSNLAAVLSLEIILTPESRITGSSCPSVINAP